MGKTYYKGFDKDFKCRGFQFEVGKTYTHEGKVSACKLGFHSCENPFDVLNYYDITSRFATVEIGGETSTHDEDSKIASAEITINKELQLFEFISSCIEYLQEFCKNDIASGDNSKLAASGDYSKLAASGYYSQLAASGDNSQLAASGNSSKLAASGNYSKLAASGYYSQLAASGDNSQLAASGNSSKLAASGDYSKLAASGYNSQLAASGESVVLISSGINSKAKSGKNGAIALTRWVESENRYRISVGYVGEDLKENVWYELDDNGNFIEVLNYE